MSFDLALTTIRFLMMLGSILCLPSIRRLQISGLEMVKTFLSILPDSILLRYSLLLREYDDDDEIRLFLERNIVLFEAKRAFLAFLLVAKTKDLFLPVELFDLVFACFIV